MGWDPFVEIPQLCDCPPATSCDGGLLDGAYSWREGAFSHHQHPLAEKAADGNAFYPLGFVGSSHSPFPSPSLTLARGFWGTGNRFI